MNSDSRKVMLAHYILLNYDPERKWTNPEIGTLTLLLDYHESMEAEMFSRAPAGPDAPSCFDYKNTTFFDKNMNTHLANHHIIDIFNEYLMNQS